jgi:hypothetical protein
MSREPGFRLQEAKLEAGKMINNRAGGIFNSYTSFHPCCKQCQNGDGRRVLIGISLHIRGSIVNPTCMRNLHYLVAVSDGDRRTL